MIIQIFGTKKHNDTKKAERFFKERKIKIQFIDLSQKGLSKGELKKISQSIGIENMIDKESKIYIEQGMKYLVFDIFEKLLENPLLIKMPVVRYKNKASIGYKPELWKTWLI